MAAPFEFSAGEAAISPSVWHGSRLRANESQAFRTPSMTHERDLSYAASPRLSNGAGASYNSLEARHFERTDSLRAVDLSVLGRPSIQEGVQRTSSARERPGVLRKRKIPTSSGPDTNPVSIYAKKSLHYAPAPHIFEIDSRKPAQHWQSRQTDQQQIGRARAPVISSRLLPRMQQERRSRHSSMWRVSPPGSVERTTLGLRSEQKANDKNQDLVDIQGITEGTEISSTRLYLGNLPHNATKQDIEDHFSTYGTGKITEVKLMNGFGFIEFEDAMDAREVVAAFSGTDFKGERLIVQFARGPRHKDDFSGPQKQAEVQRSQERARYRQRERQHTPSPDLRPRRTEVDVTNAVNDETHPMPRKLKPSKNEAAFGSIGGSTRMFICHTISEDRTGSRESVTRQRLSALGARCRKREMLHVSHSLVRERTDAMEGTPETGDDRLDPFDFDQPFDKLEHHRPRDLDSLLERPQHQPTRYANGVIDLDRLLAT